MTLNDLRKRVLFQNSIDVWIESCQDAGIDWNRLPEYMRFIAYLRGLQLNLRAFNLCAHEAGAVEKEKTEFAEALRNTRDPNAATYTIKLSDAAIESIRRFHT
jgi:hypothetical protein